MKAIVLYHANCTDGFSAAAVAFKALMPKHDVYREKNLGKAGHEFVFTDGHVVFRPVQYGQQLSDIIAELTLICSDGSPQTFAEYTLYILDFSFPVNQLDWVMEFVKELIVLDHHKSAQESLKNIIGDRYIIVEPGEYTEKQLLQKGKHRNVVFDMDHCGAVMTHQYFFPNLEVPLFLKYVQDRDLWQWKLPNSREVSAGIGLIPRDLRTFSQYAFRPSVIQLAEDGKLILTREKQLILSLASKAVFSHVENDKDSIEMFAVNSPIFQSEICEEILEQHPEIKVASCYFHDIEKDEFIFSVRSRQRDLPSSETALAVAKIFNGGGHDCAAGFRTKFAPSPTGDA